MEKTTLTIPNISCAHCVSAIKTELGDMNGVFRVDGDPSTQTIIVEWSAPVTLEAIKNVLTEMNYPAA